MPQDPYAHRKHRVKYQLGYGAEGAARGKNELPSDVKDVSPKDESYKKADNKAHLDGSPKHKTRPNPY